MDRANLEAEIDKLIVETGKINAEARKLTREAFWYPILISAALIAMATIVAKLLG